MNPTQPQPPENYLIVPRPVLERHGALEGLKRHYNGEWHPVNHPIGQPLGAYLLSFLLAAPADVLRRLEEGEPKWHNPDSLPSAGEAPWRFLVKGEEVQAGDEVYNGGHHWFTSYRNGAVIDEHTYRTQRPLPTNLRNGGGEGETPRTERAQRDWQRKADTHPDGASLDEPWDFAKELERETASLRAEVEETGDLLKAKDELLLNACEDVKLLTAAKEDAESRIAEMVKVVISMIESPIGDLKITREKLETANRTNDELEREATTLRSALEEARRERDEAIKQRDEGLAVYAQKVKECCEQVGEILDLEHQVRVLKSHLDVA